MTAEPTRGWALACVVCRRGWPEDAVMEEVRVHWNEHAETGAYLLSEHGLAEFDEPHLELVWLGPGPAPKRNLRQ